MQWKRYAKIKSKIFVTWNENKKMHLANLEFSRKFWDFPGLNKKIPGLFQGCPGNSRASKIFHGFPGFSGLIQTLCKATFRKLPSTFSLKELQKWGGHGGVSAHSGKKADYNNYYIP